MTLAEAQARRARDGAAGGRKPGRPRLSDEAVALTRDALRAAGGNISRAAKALGMSMVGLYHRTINHPAAWPEGVAHVRPGHGARPLRGGTPDAVIVATREAIRASAGDITKAALALGLSATSVRARLKLHPETWPDGVPPRRRPGATAIERAPDAVIAATHAALRASGGNVTVAAATMGVSKQGLHYWVNRYPETWPADVPRRRRAKKTPR